MNTGAHVQTRPSEEQAILRDSLRRYLQLERRGPAEAAWSGLAEMGLLALNLPQEAGGFGGGAFDAALVAEELGRALAREPVVATGVAGEVLGGLAPLPLEMLAGLGRGELRVVLAHHEPDAELDVLRVRTRARLDGAGRHVLEGRKSAVLGAPSADVILVTAALQGDGEAPVSIGLFAAPAKTDGLTIKAYRTIDDRQAATVEFSGMTLAPEALLGSPGQAAGAVGRGIDYGLVMASADALGAMEAAFWMTRDYLLTRRQFGAPIAELQVLRHRLADMFIELEQARSMVFVGVAALAGEDPVERARTVAAVKARVGQAGRFVTGQAIQLHGGIGVTQEHKVGRYFKRLVAFDLWWGGAAYHLARRRSPEGVHDAGRGRKGV
jgi:alkylation response protein AidB-like acyl-CoA dehydrogenase